MGNCADCKNYDVHDARGVDEFRCRYYYQFYVPSESCSGHYSYDPLKRDEVAKMIKKRRSYYITSVICEILGLDHDEKGYMKTFETLRDEVLKTPESAKFMEYYDTVGSVVREKLLQMDELQAKTIALYISNKYFNLVKSAIEKNDIIMATNIYFLMCQELANMFKITYTYENNDNKNIAFKKELA